MLLENLWDLLEDRLEDLLFLSVFLLLEKDLTLFFESVLDLDFFEDFDLEHDFFDLENDFLDLENLLFDLEQVLFLRCLLLFLECDLLLDLLFLLLEVLDNLLLLSDFDFEHFLDFVLEPCLKFSSFFMISGVGPLHPHGAGAPTAGAKWKDKIFRMLTNESSFLQLVL